METWRTTEAGRHFRALLEGVRRGRWRLVGESGRVEAVLADAEEIGDLLGAAYCFRPKTACGGHGAEIRLPEVGAHVVGAPRHGRGAPRPWRPRSRRGLDEARRELAAAMITFARDWEQQVQHTADQNLKAGYVRRIQLAGDEAGVLAMLDHDAAAEGMATTFARPSPSLDGTQPRRWMGPRDRLAQVHEARSNEHEPE